jgi:hypothetical protein
VGSFSTDNSHRFGKPIQGKYLPVSYVGGFFEAFNGRDGRGRTRGYYPIFGRVILAIEAYEMIIRKSGLAKLHLGPETAESLFGIMFLNGAYD